VWGELSVDWLQGLLEAGRRMAPHGYCLLWDPGLVWTHVVADSLIAASYFSIPVALLFFARKRRDLEFRYVFLLFALFIVACGMTHLMSIWTLWHADYGVEAMIKVVTALASVGTAIALWPLLPKALLLPSPGQLREQNVQLERALSNLTIETRERQRAEEALIQAQKMDAVGRLTGGIAHDFNNLLQTMSGSLSLIARSPQSDNVQRWAELGSQAVDRGARLTAQLLTFSRTRQLILKPCTVAPLIAGMAQLLRTSIDPSIDLRFHLDGPDYVSVLADETQIELAVMNLAINARDAMPDGGRIDITTRQVALAGDPELPDGAYLELLVADNGTGMSEEVRAKAFEPFFTTKEVGKGTGLGLSMVYGMARQSGGRAQIASAEGEGTTVSILFPAVPEEAVETGKPARAVEAGTRPLRITLVDDEPDGLEVAAALLESLGHEVARCGDGITARGAVARNVPDLLITDYAMPGITGAQLAAQLRDDGFAIPIIFASGFADADVLRSIVGSTELILQKPYTLEKLQQALNAAVAQLG
jgi:signal transduction histidine kinase